MATRENISSADTIITQFIECSRELIFLCDCKMHIRYLVYSIDQTSLVRKLTIASHSVAAFVLSIGIWRYASLNLFYSGVDTYRQIAIKYTVNFCQFGLRLPSTSNKQIYLFDLSGESRTHGSCKMIHGKL